MTYQNAKPWRKNKTSRITQHTAQSKCRGTLKPLLSDDAKTTSNIQELTYDFSCRIIRLFQYLNEDSEYKEYIMSKQVFRSGTSIAANTAEAQYAQSKADFLSKLSIAYKEADESDFWINLLHDNGYINDTQFISINSDITRILKILTTIVKKLRIKNL